MNDTEVGAVIDGMTVKWVIELGPKETLTVEQQRLILEWMGAVHYSPADGDAIRMVGVE